MSASIFVQQISQEEYHIKIQASDWELNVHLPHKEFYELSRIHTANWETRASIKAGLSAGASVFWTYHSGRRVVTILVGHDDETWDFAVVVPEFQFIEAVSPYMAINDQSISDT